MPRVCDQTHSPTDHAHRYAIKVRACNVNGWGSWSTRSEDMVTLPEVVPASDAPTDAADTTATSAGDAAGTDGNTSSSAGGGKPKKRASRSPVVGASTSPPNRADRGSFFLGGASFAKELAHRAAMAIGLEEEEAAAAEAAAGSVAAAPAAGDTATVAATSNAGGTGDANADADDDLRRTRIRRQSSVLMGAAGVRYKDPATRAVAQSADTAASDVLRRALMHCSLAYSAAVARVQGVPAPPAPPRASHDTAGPVPPPPPLAADMASAGDIAALKSTRVATTRQFMYALVLCSCGRAVCPQ